MIKPWKLGISIFVCALVFSGWILAAWAPVEMVEMELVGSIGDDTLEWIQSEYEGIRPSLWIQRETEAYRLVMTSGNDRFFQKDGPGTGRWLLESDQNKLVLGEDLVDRYFQRHDVIGREMEFLGETYEVVGLAENSKSIWIPYSEELEDRLDWDRRILRYQIPNESFEDSFISKLRQEFRRYDVSVLLVLNHSNWRWAYFNVALVILLLFMWRRFYRKGRQTFVEMRAYVHQYRLTHRLKSISQYISENREGAKQIGKELAVALLWGGGIVFFARYLEMPASLRPKNLFSLVSYGDLAKQVGDRIALNLRIGLSDFQIRIAILWVLCLVLGVAAAWIAAGRGRRNG